MRTRTATFGDFRCAHCHVIVSSAHVLCGVNHRNHCPYCLWSRHLDLFAAGDRLSACKGQMKPIGLTMKPGRNKYRLDQRGELMLIHECTECKAVSINRIAADDDLAAIMAVFRESTQGQIQRMGELHGIRMLKPYDIDILQKQLYGGTDIRVEV